MKSYWFLFFGLVFASCNKSDLVPPTIEAVTVNNESGVVLEFQPGESFIIRSLINDNKALGQFKIDIHHDFDGHSHKSSTVRYAEIRIKDLSGLSYNLEESFTIPLDASSGTYHGTIQALDAEGNVSPPSLFYFNIVRNNQPTIVMDIPEQLPIGATLQVQGLISAQDEATLNTVRIRVRSTRTGNTIHNQTYNLAPGTTSWNPFIDGNVSIVIPQQENEKLIFRLWVEDSNGNNTIFETEIIIV
jgi:hypothetical protein